MTVHVTEFPGDGVAFVQMVPDRALLNSAPTSASLYGCHKLHTTLWLSSAPVTIQNVFANHYGSAVLMHLMGIMIYGMMAAARWDTECR